MSIHTNSSQDLNIILITIDCFRYDRCEFNGYYRRQLPILNSLSQEAFVFDHAYSTGPYTTESVPGIIAGQHSYNGVYFGHDPAWKAIPADSTTIASHLSDLGYSTIAVLSNPHLTSVRNFDTGFDHFHNLRTEGEDKAEGDSDIAEENNPSLIDRLRGRFKQSNRKYSPLVFPFTGYRYYQYRTDWPSIDGKTLREEFCSQLNSTESPFFAWTHLMDPHAPISPRVTKTDESLENKIGTISHLYHIGNHSRDYHDPAYDRIYDSSIRYVDSQVGEIINTLQSMGQWEETILIVTGDHGEVLNDRMGIRGHPRHHHYDELLRVPLLVRIPDFEGERIERPISLAWVPKLITELLHLPSGDFPYERGEPTIFEAETDTNPPVISDSLDRHGHTITVRDGRHKLIHHKEDKNTLNTSYPYFTENISFQYRTDPTERDPIQKHSKKQLETVVYDIATEQDTIPNIRGEFSQAIENRLKDLGYKMD